MEGQIKYSPSFSQTGCSEPSRLMVFYTNCFKLSLILKTRTQKTNNCFTMIAPELRVRLKKEVKKDLQREDSTKLT